jgi:hypothetical protein
VITFKSGDQVNARVTEITDDKIKYKRCDNLDGPVFVANKSTVALIKYSNGVVEKVEAPATSVYSSGTNSTPMNPYYGPQKVHPLAMWSLVALLLAPLTIGIGWIAALMMANRAIREINLDPKKWRGLMLAKVVKVLALVSIILFCLLLILILSAV